MAKIKKVKVGNVVHQDAFVSLLTLIIFKEVSDGYGVIKHVEPTPTEITMYKEINPNANGAGKVIYFDKTANRHFITPVKKLKVVDLNKPKRGLAKWLT